MRPVKTKPRFKCDFCRFTATEPTVKKHEPRCWGNPDRYCDYCNNKGHITVVHGDLVEEGDCGLSQDIPCPYCSQFRSDLEALNGEMIAEPQPLKVTV